MRVRFRPEVLPRFGYFFCCSFLFQAQVERAKRGMGNMTNFFPGQLLRFMIVCPSREEQQRIIALIEEALSSREQLETKLVEVRNEIDEAIRAVLVQ